jgi:hypothetical protein
MTPLSDEERANVEALVESWIRVDHRQPLAEKVWRAATAYAYEQSAKICDEFDKLTITDVNGVEHKGCGIPADPESAEYSGRLEKLADAIRARIKE